MSDTNGTTTTESALPPLTTDQRARIVALLLRLAAAIPRPRNGYRVTQRIVKTPTGGAHTAGYEVSTVESVLQPTQPIAMVASRQLADFLAATLAQAPYFPTLLVWEDDQRRILELSDVLVACRDALTDFAQVRRITDDEGDRYRADRASALLTVVHAALAQHGPTSTTDTEPKG